MDDFYGQAQTGPRPTLGKAARACRPGQVVPARRGQREMVVARLPTGEVVAVPDHCPHAGVRLSEGFIEDGHLVCPMHGWAFDLTTGQCATNPQVFIEITRLQGRTEPRSQAPRPTDDRVQQSLDLAPKPPEAET